MKWLMFGHFWPPAKGFVFLRLVGEHKKSVRTKIEPSNPVIFFPNSLIYSVTVIHTYLNCPFLASKKNILRNYFRKRGQRKYKLNLWNIDSSRGGEIVVVTLLDVFETNKTEINGKENSKLRPNFLAWENSVGNYPSSPLPTFSLSLRSNIL